MRYSFLVLFLIAGSIANAQNVREENIKFDGKQRPGIVAIIPFPPDVVENAISEKMGKEGYKGSSSRGWTVYKGVKLKSLGDDRVDVYVKIDRKSRKESDVSEVQILVAKGYDNFAEGKSAEIAGGIAFIDDISPMAESMNLEIQIRKQEEALKTSQKKFDNLVTDSLDLDKKKKKLDESLLDNSRKQGEQKKEIERQQAILDELKSRRKA